MPPKKVKSTLRILQCSVKHHVEPTCSPKKMRVFKYQSVYCAKETSIGGSMGSVLNEHTTYKSRKDTSSLFFFAAASPTLYYQIEPKFYVNFRQSEVFLNCNIHHTS